MRRGGHAGRMLALGVLTLWLAGAPPRAGAQSGPQSGPQSGRGADSSLATAPAPAPSPGGAVARAQARREAQRAAHRYDDVFRRYSKRYFGAAFDWRWFKAQGMAESNLDSAATSRVGARGVMQLMPATYKAIQSKRPEFGAIDDPEWNIAAGIMHDRYLWKLWERKVTDEERFAFMFASYNAGERTIGRAADSARVAAGSPTPAWVHVEQVAPRVPRWRYRETLDYVRKIDRYYGKLRATR